MGDLILAIIFLIILMLLILSMGAIVRRNYDEGYKDGYAAALEEIESKGAKE